MTSRRWGRPRRGGSWLLEGLAVELHRVAAFDEDLTTSSGLQRALDAAGIPMIGEVDPLVRLESTVLVRRLRAIASGPDRRRTGREGRAG